ncbi:hypothetical protein [Beijerinckia mobilis]|uniref:hypothetical protein n=1 Tax=Beijerinckia mobilis TaxID=231434 RepID=UPI0012EBEA17|nr:hypothetical protein [Beijerinckia mobilis]
MKDEITTSTKAWWPDLGHGAEESGPGLRIEGESAQSSLTGAAGGVFVPPGRLGMVDNIATLHSPSANEVRTNSLVRPPKFRSSGLLMAL